MKKFIICAAVLALCLTACKKEEMTFSQFTAGMEQADQQGSKLYLDGDFVKWDGTECVYIANTDDPYENNGDFAVTPRSDDATWATLTGPSITGTHFSAIYPRSIATTGPASRISLYQGQNSPAGNIQCPMYAESEDDNFQFKHLCGYLKVHLQQEGVLVQGIEVTADVPITGDYNVSLDGNGKPVLTRETPGLSDANKLTLYCPTPQSIGGEGGHDFYIYLPPSGSTGYQLSIKIIDENGGTCVKTGSQPVVVNRAEITTITVSNTLEFVPYGRLNGLFTVGEGHQVYFSRGNLVVSHSANVTKSAGSAEDWDFHAHQYDMLGTNNSVEGSCDLFGWSTGSTHFGLSTSRDTSDYSGTFVDWGVLFAPHDYRTLTAAEWRYLIYSRTNAASKYGVGRIQKGNDTYVNGMIFLPDNWTLPAGCTFSSGLGNTRSDFTKNSYTLSQWSQMEAAGAVFLPAGGYRTGSSFFTNVYYTGYYWSSTSTYVGCADNLSFDGLTRQVTGDAAKRFYGRSVRLVMDAQ